MACCICANLVLSKFFFYWFDVLYMRPCIFTESVLSTKKYIDSACCICTELVLSKKKIYDLGLLMIYLLLSDIVSIIVCRVDYWFSFIRVDKRLLCLILEFTFQGYECGGYAWKIEVLAKQSAVEIFVYHIFLHCATVSNIYDDVLSLLGICWLMPELVQAMFFFCKGHQVVMETCKIWKNGAIVHLLVDFESKKLKMML